MMMLITSLMSLSTAIVFMQVNHPLAMGLTLLIQTITICLMVGTVSKTFWFSYILFLVFLGGMLVLFIYVTALASNEMFSMSTLTSMMMLYTIMMMITMSILTDTFIIHPMTENIDSTSMSMEFMNQENCTMLNKLYNSPTNTTTIMLMSYLLITLIAVVKVTNVFQGPLRKIN